jgi:C2H2-type zinc finger
VAVDAMNIDRLAEALRAELVEREGECDRIRAALAALDGAAPPVENPAPPKPRPIRPKPPRHVPKQGDYRCDQCSQTFSRPNGLSRHMNQTHAITARRARLEHPDRSAPVTTELVLRCSQCAFEFASDDADALADHCRTLHERSPNDIERRPRPTRPELSSAIGSKP